MWMISKIVFLTYQLPVRRGFNDIEFKKLTEEIILAKIINFNQPIIVLMQMGS